jgi:hypothetical protein
LRALQDIPLDTHVTQNERQGKYIPLLDALLPHVRNAIGGIFEGVDDGYTEFSQVNTAVRNCLAAGIVPSTLNIRTGKAEEDTTAFRASPLTLLNSGMEFYLTRINDLITSVRGEDLHNYPRRLHWIRRVEEWVAKAIEDLSIAPEEDSHD